MGVVGNYVAGQILYAANLNNSFAEAAAISGDTFTGNVTIPNLSVSGIEYVNTLVSNTKLSVNNIDIGSGLQGAYNTANAAFAAANTSNANLNVVLLQTIFNAANAAANTANAALPKTGGVVSDTITLNSTLNVSNTITGNTEIHGSANSIIYPGQFRAIQGNYGTIIRNDGSSFYILTTDNVGPNLAGTSNYNTLRPFTFSLSNGSVTIDGTGAGTNFGGNVSMNGITAQTANIAQIRIQNFINAGTYNLLPQDSGSTIYYSNSNPLIVVVNNNLFPGFHVIFTQMGSGSITFQQGSSVLINPRTGTLFQITGQYGSASLVSYAQNSFILDGSIQ